MPLKTMRSGYALAAIPSVLISTFVLSSGAALRAQENGRGRKLPADPSCAPCRRQMHRSKAAKLRWTNVGGSVLHRVSRYSMWNNLRRIAAIWRAAEQNRRGSFASRPGAHWDYKVDSYYGSGQGVKRHSSPGWRRTGAPASDLARDDQAYKGAGEALSGKLSPAETA